MLTEMFCSVVNLRSRFHLMTLYSNCELQAVKIMFSENDSPYESNAVMVSGAKGPLETFITYGIKNNLLVLTIILLWNHDAIDLSSSCISLNFIVPYAFLWS